MENPSQSSASYFEGHHAGTENHIGIKPIFKIDDNQRTLTMIQGGSGLISWCELNQEKESIETIVKIENKDLGFVNVSIASFPNNYGKYDEQIAALMASFYNDTVYHINNF